MKLSTLFLNCLLALLLTISFSCKDDDESMEEEQADPFTASCCEIPHLEGCVGGANIFVPNAFTANADGFSDIFYVHGGQGVKEIVEFKIFDADGNIVYEAYNFQPNDFDFGWDGSLPDGTVVDAVYSYTVSVTNIANVTVEFEGQVCCRTGFFACVDNEQHCVYSTQHDGNGGFEPTLPPFEECQ